jgi:hypothetical protein
MINNKLKQQLEQPRQPTDSPLARSLTKAVYRKLLFGFLMFSGGGLKCQPS